MQKRRRPLSGLIAVLLAGCAQFVPTQSRTAGSTSELTLAPSSTPTESTPSATLAPTPALTPVATKSATVLPDLSKVERGITYSFSHTTWLYQGTRRSPQSALRELACGLGVKHVRVVFVRGWLKDSSPNDFKSAYNLDWQFQILEECGVESVTVVIGRKQPHWPECHEPKYTATMTQQQYKDHIFQFNRESMAYISDKPIVKKIQIGNEESFDFGVCREIEDPEGFFSEQIRQVRSADPLHRTIVATVNGRTAEGVWGPWEKMAQFDVDEVGVTYYDRGYWNGEYHEYLNGTPAEWATKLLKLKKKSSVSELQWEPWEENDLRSLSPGESLKSMGQERMIKSLRFVLDAGFDEVDFWGAEYWLYLKDRGYPQMWDTAKEVFSK